MEEITATATAATATATETTAGAAQETAQETATYTAEQVEQLKAELEQQWQTKLTEAANAAKKAGLSEAERLAQMSEAERLQEQLKQLQTENEQYKSSESRRTLEAEAAKALANEQLPASFVGMVMADNAEGIKANIAAVKEAFATAVQAEVEARIKGKTPAAGGGAPATEAEQIRAQVKEIMKRGR